MKTRLAVLSVMTAGAIHGAALSGEAPPPILEAEVSDVLPMPADHAHRVFLLGQRIIVANGNAAKIEGAMHANMSPLFAADASRKAFYLVETAFSRGNRGKREDLITVYDPATLTIVSEILIPERLIGGRTTRNFALSAEGRYGYVYNLAPSSSVTVVDLAKRAVHATVDVPGCAVIFPVREQGFLALCADGSLALASVGADRKVSVSHTKSFHNPEFDPIFEESAFEAAKGKGVFLSYNGLVYTVSADKDVRVDRPWSLAEAAGFPRPTEDPQMTTWRPGGDQPLALHKKSGRIYVLMHEGKLWSHGKPAAEVWVVDVAQKQVVNHFLSPIPAQAIAVSEEDVPTVYLLSEGRTMVAVNGQTGETIKEMKDAGRMFALSPGS